jgi:hypothetical protein
VRQHDEWSRAGGQIGEPQSVSDDKLDIHWLPQLRSTART